MRSFLQLMLMLLIASGCLFGAYYLGKDSPTKLIKWKWTTGNVFGYTKRQGNTFKDLRVKFQYNEKMYEFTTTEDTQNFINNERVGVVFPEQAPEKAELRSYKRLLFFPALLLVAGLFMGVVALIVLFRLVRGKNIQTGE